MASANIFRLNLHGPSINDTSLISLCDSNLTELRLSSCPLITDQGLKFIFEQGEIKNISIALCPQLTDLTLEVIAAYLQKLQKIELSDQPHLSDRSIRILLASCQSIESLSINRCESLTDQTLYAISLFGKKINFLRLSNHFNFTKAGYAMIPRHLKTLNISSSLELTDSICQDLISTSPDLSYLDVSFCTQLQNPILQQTTSLQILNLQGCSLLSDSGIEGISTLCPSLTHLYLAYSAITDRALESLSENAPQLKVLDLSRCPLITSSGVEKILQSCRSLEQLNLLNCPQLEKKHHSFLKKTG